LQLQALADAEIETLGDILVATATLLDRLPTAGTQPEREALAADFDAAMRALRAELALHPARDGQGADSLIVGALVRVIRLVETAPVEPADGGLELPEDERPVLRPRLFQCPTQLVHESSELRVDGG
jgi:hypothetical protein